MDRHYPLVPRIGVAAIVLDEDRVLLVKRGRDPGKGQWSLPGGLVELGEGIQEALFREIREETSLQIALGGLVGVFERIVRDSEGRIAYHYVLADYWARRVSGCARPGSDVSAVRMLPLRDLAAFMLDREVKEAILKAERMSRQAGERPCSVAGLLRRMEEGSGEG